MLGRELLHVGAQTPEARQEMVDHHLLGNEAAGEGAVGLEQLGGNVNPLAFRCLAVVSQRELVKVWQHKLVSEARLCIRSDPPERPDDLHVQRVLILVLRVFQERCQLHFNTLQQLFLCDGLHDGTEGRNSGYPH